MTASIGWLEIPHTPRSRKRHQDRKPNWIMAETAKLNLRIVKCGTETDTHAAWWMFGMANRGVCLRPLGETTKGITAHWHLKSALSEFISAAHCDGVYYYFHGRLCSRRLCTENHDAAAATAANHFSHNAAARQYAYSQPVCALLFQFTVCSGECAVCQSGCAAIWIMNWRPVSVITF